MNLTFISLILFVIPLSAQTIAVLGYGSLMKHPKRPWGELLIIDTFKKTDFTLPVRLSRVSAWKEYPNNKNRHPSRKLTMIIDPHASQKEIYAATCSYNNLVPAKHNLAKREGSTSKYIAYVRQLEPQQPKNEKEDFLYHYQGALWTGSLLQLPVDEAKKIVKWAHKNKFDAVIWTSVPATLTNKTNAQIMELLKADKDLLKNTQNYIQLLPEDLLTPLLKAIMELHAEQFDT